jgi:hypothetical protein
MDVSREEMSGHPDLNAIAALADGRLEEPSRAALVGHLADCAECRGLLAACVGRVGAANQRAARWRVPGAGALTRPRVWLPLAATLTIATIVGLQVSRRPVAPLSDMPATSVAPPSDPAATSVAPQSDAAATSVAPTSDKAATSVAAPAVDPDRMAGPPALARPVAPPSAPAEDLVAKRGAGTREVGGRTFRLVAGEWIDSAYDPLALLPMEAVAGPAARAALLARLPALEPVADLGPRVLVVHDGLVYRFTP